MPMRPDRARARARLGLPAEAPILAVLPGSRLGEIARLGADFLQAAGLVAEGLPGLQVVIPAANADCRAAIEQLLQSHPLPGARVIDGQARHAMVASDVVLLASGTATLEAMLAKRPMVVGYRVAGSTYRLVKGLGMLKVDHYALPNVLAGEELVPELMQDECTPALLSDAVLRWFRDPAAVEALVPRFDAIHGSLQRDASVYAARALDELLRAEPPRG